MPFTIDTFTPKVYNQFTNGQNLDQNLTFFDATFTGNVEKVRVECEFEFTWFAEARSDNWQVQVGGILSNVVNFRNEGFAAGQQFEFYSNFADRYTTSPDFTGQITYFLNDGRFIGFTLLSGTVPTGTLTGCGIWADASQELNKQNAIIVNFGLPQNNSNDSFSSLLDNSVQRYETNQVNNTGVTVLNWASSTKSAQTGTMQVERVAQVNKNTVRYILRHDLVINPYWLDTDDQVILNPPNNDFKQVVSSFIDRFAGNNCLRYINEIEVRQTYTNPQNRKAKISLVGNTGWFYDNFNSGSFKFEQATDIIYNGGSTTGLVFGQANTIEFTIKAIDNESIDSNARFGVYTSILPPANRYQNQATNFISNFAFDVAVNSEGATAVNGENGIITDCVGSLISVSGVNHLQVTATINFTGTTAQFNDNFVIWAGIETPNVSTPAGDRCNEVATSGGAGITEEIYNLDPAGGIIVFDCDMFSQVDKLEIIHNGVKKATTYLDIPASAADRGNSSLGFDPANDATNYPAGDWYIGSLKGVIPKRFTECQAITGFSVPMGANDQQRTWWVYTAADVVTNPQIIVRVTGTTGTAWRFKRVCPE